MGLSRARVFDFEAEVIEEICEQEDRADGGYGVEDAGDCFGGLDSFVFVGHFGLLVVGCDER
jgi:hypothetical protein